VYLKVTRPEGNGDPATVQDAVAALARRRIVSYDKIVVKAIVDKSVGNYIRVASFQHTATNDSFIRVEVDDNQMKAFIMVTPPGVGGGDADYDTYVTLLNNNNVTFGIKEDFLQHFSDKPRYGEKVCVAEGTKPVNGMDSYLEYFFDIDTSKVKLREAASGNINFKELNLVQNIMAGKAVAKAHPAEPGIPGQTVTGTIIPAQDGKEVALPLGKNVHLDIDGVTILSDINGQVLIDGGKICIEPVLTIEGSVGVKTGNVMFLGTVIVKGNVEAGFSIKATSNIEINGTVGKSELDAEGDIVVKGGISGSKELNVNANGTIWAKFIENASVKAGDSVVVTDGIINSSIDAQKTIVCQGKRASIIGGRLRASEEINSKTIGSASGSAPTY
jgi:uncharacterized protein (DUF342 family)